MQFLTINEPNNSASDLYAIQQSAYEKSKRRWAAINKQKQVEAANRRAAQARKIGQFRAMPVKEKAKVVGGKVANVARRVKTNLGEGFGERAAYSMGQGVRAFRHGYSAADSWKTPKPKKARKGKQAGTKRISKQTQSLIYGQAPKKAPRKAPRKQGKQHSVTFDWDSF